jgi:hypothetical protein
MLKTRPRATTRHHTHVPVRVREESPPPPAAPRLCLAVPHGGGEGRRSGGGGAGRRDLGFPRWRPRGEGERRGGYILIFPSVLLLYPIFSNPL